MYVYVIKYRDSFTFFTGHKICVSCFCTTSARNTFRSDRKAVSYFRDARRNACLPPWEVSVVAVASTGFRLCQRTSESSSMKIRWAVFELFRVNRQMWQCQQLHADSERFWSWFVTVRITGILDFVHRSVLYVTLVKSVSFHCYIQCSWITFCWLDSWQKCSPPFGSL
jgi:hypothetical protein